MINSRIHIKLGALILVVSFFCVFSLKGNDLNSNIETNELLVLANTGKSLNSLTTREKKVILLINLARMNGELFVENYLNEYVKKNKVRKNKYYKSLVNTLNQQASLPALQPQNDLIEESINHAKELGYSGKIGHRSRNLSFAERMSRFNDKYKKVKEVNQYGDLDALSIVVHLLIDDDKKSLIQRKKILNKEAKYIGVGCRAHKVYRINTTILLGNGLVNE